MSDGELVEVARFNIRYGASEPVLAWLRRQAGRWTFETRADPPGSHIRLITVFARQGSIPAFEQAMFKSAIRTAFPRPRPWLGWEDEEM